MPGYSANPPIGYLECEYASPWPGLVTNLPTSRIPSGAASSSSAMNVRGRLTPQPAVYSVTGSGGLNVAAPVLSAGENVCKVSNLQPPGQQNGFTVIITNMAVYIDYVLPATGTAKVFTKVFTFPTPYPRYAHFDTCVIENSLYISSASQLGLWRLSPFYILQTGSITVEITDLGNGYTSAPTVTMYGGGGTPLTGTATISNGQLATISFSGYGRFIKPPSILLTGGLGSGSSGTSTNYSPGSALPVSASVTQSSPGTSSTNSTVVDAFASVPISGVTLSASITWDGSVSIVSAGDALIIFQASPDNGTTWYNLDSLGYSSTVTIPSNVIGVSLPFTVANIDTIQFRVVSQATVYSTGGPSGTVSTSATITALTLTVTAPGGPAYQGAASVVLSPSQLGGYLVTEVSAPTGVNAVSVSAAGTTYNVNDKVVFQGGGGSGATGVLMLNSSNGVAGVMMTNLGKGYTSPPTVTIITSTGSGASLQAVLQKGSAFIGGDFMSSMSGRLLLANVIGGDGNTTSGIWQIIVTNGGSGYTTAPTVQILFGGGDGATATANVAAGAVTTITVNTIGTGFTSAPTINLLSSVGTGATAFAVLTGPLYNSTTTAFPDYVSWSGADAFTYFDSNYGLAPGGYNQLAEAQGLISSLNVVESVAYIGHNGGMTEVTPNTSSSIVAFAFYPIWGGDQGQIVRYGSMGQFGTTLAFLAQDTAWIMSPGGMQEIGGNIANLLQDITLWANGNFPLQGLYGSIVLIEGQKHYLVVLSSDDSNLNKGNSARKTTVYDYNMSENSWNTWSYSGQTATCAIYQSFDAQPYTYTSGVTLNGIAVDQWLMIGLTASTGAGPTYNELASVYEAAPLTRTLALLQAGFNAPLISSTLAYQFNTEAPSIARMQQERRIALEYENQTVLVGLSITPTVTLTYTGQQDPTAQTGTVSQQQTSTATLNSVSTSNISGQVITNQADFNTFTGVCTSLGISATGNNSLVALVRMTQVGVLPKKELT